MELDLGEYGRFIKLQAMCRGFQEELRCSMTMNTKDIHDDIIAANDEISLLINA